MSIMSKSMLKIHTTFINGNKRETVRMIQEYGLYDFFSFYERFLNDTYVSPEVIHNYFVDMVVSYHRITNR